MFAFDVGDIVILKRDDPPEFSAGDAGVVWGTYGFPPSLYEATFCNPAGQEADRMFEAPDVEKASDVTQVHLTDSLWEFRDSLTGKNP